MLLHVQSLTAGHVSLDHGEAVAVEYLPAHAPSAQTQLKENLLKLS